MVLRSCSAILFKPLYHLYSMSSRYATIPHSWKVHRIIPTVSLKLAIRTLSNVIVPFPNLSKVLEHLIYNKIILKLTNSISNAQFGFLQNCSTLQQLLLFTKEFFSSTSQIDTVYFIYTKLLIQYLTIYFFLNYGHAESLVLVQIVLVRSIPICNYKQLFFKPSYQLYPESPRVVFLVLHYSSSILMTSFFLNILSKLFTFAGVSDPSDQQALQSDINQFFNWTFTSCLSFSPTTYLSGPK